MLFRFIAFLMLINLYVIPIQAQSTLDYPSIDMMLNTMPTNDDDVMTTFEAMFIKDMFLDSMFLESDEEEGAAFGGFYNDIIATHLARQLAKQDILHLKRLIQYQAQ